MSWEDKFHSWSQAPSQIEQDKCDNAERAIIQAIRDDKTLSQLDVRVFAQGSYRVRTNIRLDNDVDTNVYLQEPFYCHYDLPVVMEKFWALRRIVYGLRRGQRGTLLSKLVGIIIQRFQYENRSSS